ncbi:MAG: phosphoribosylanthranilate isomerase [Deltaproteobacteria bacterium]|nr:phosphoribosylanthranilate isomerase [Deltaproteobacteria bacterium]
MTVWIKICGITNEEDGLAAGHFGADALGFIFAPSPRRISPEKAQEVIKALPPLVQTVGVFVNEDRATVSSLAEMCGLDVLQFHGNEPADYCDSFDHPVIKAVRLKNRQDLKSLAKYDGVVHALLLDTYVPDKLGGTGVTFNWEWAAEARNYGRIILAGGLNPANVTAAIRIAKPYGVDASSSLEHCPGIKDHAKMAQFIERVRQSERR